MAPCNPPLNFVPNGAAGSAFPAPLDPTDLPSVDPNPGFGDLASSYLDALDPATDGSDQVESDAAAAVDTLDTIGTALDATLDTILVLLDQAQPGPVDDALGTFAGAQPTSQGFVDGVNGVDVPAIGQVPMVLPNGQATITFGAPPELGGVPRAGAASYVLELPVSRASANFTPDIKVLNLVGPNPPFVTAGQFRRATINGTLMWVAPITINPAQAGTFTGTLYWSFTGTVAGFTGTFQRQLPFQVVVEP